MSWNNRMITGFPIGPVKVPLKSFHIMKFYPNYTLKATGRGAEPGTVDESPQSTTSKGDANRKPLQRQGIIMSRIRYVGIKIRVLARWLRFKTPRHNKVAICCIFQNDAAFLREWIDFHHVNGVDHFFLYNNQSQDNYKEVLQPYERIGLVTLKNAIPHSPFMEQVVKCYNDCLLNTSGKKYRWIAFLDSDEFIVPKKSHSIKSFLQDYETYPGVFINWLIFGSSGVQELKQGEYMTEKLLYRFPTQHNEHLNGKTIMQPSSGMLFYKGNPHYPEYTPFNRIVYSDKTPLKPAQGDRKIYIEDIQLNHYWYRTERFYQEVKIPRRFAFEGKDRKPDLEIWHRKMANSTYDDSALKFLPMLKSHTLY